ncbi:hypothetical protein [Euzebya rosea]|uniref:hypothetical protein n=1 Tax=Euzebya rosea TaxID=2052804 RepID=UPI0013008841|nr:hypothetical protein [Euzebya rosea]
MIRRTIGQVRQRPRVAFLAGFFAWAAVILVPPYNVPLPAPQLWPIVAGIAAYGCTTALLRGRPVHTETVHLIRGFALVRAVAVAVDAVVDGRFADSTLLAVGLWIGIVMVTVWSTEPEAAREHEGHA